ncbi:hypothetical protein [Pseudonocardia sp. KRD291]|uniref:hypothetical protein n=1 Tax=Pseudonocardia sp. KRD291 TaxID=2792007 RepID=UPI001C49EEED|nr:hypothetical protein [Pseudonocardia sp. KRD291]MBW0101141.1 hypothetical protein [Pseudonocardia sp. KRD291]
MVTVVAPRTLRPALVVSLVGFAWWFFGNLYEAVVISPNWVTDSPAQLTRLHEFFVVTGPTLYFIPANPVAVVVFWAALVIGRRVLPRRLAAAALVASVLLVALTAVIVAVLVRGLFGADYLDHADRLVDYARWWNVANAVRMALTATCLVLVWRMLRRL